MGLMHVRRGGLGSETRPSQTEHIESGQSAVLALLFFIRAGGSIKSTASEQLDRVGWVEFRFEGGATQQVGLFDCGAQSAVGDEGSHGGHFRLAEPTEPYNANGTEAGRRDRPQRHQPENAGRSYTTTLGDWVVPAKIGGGGGDGVVPRVKPSSSPATGSEARGVRECLARRVCRSYHAASCCPQSILLCARIHFTPAPKLYWVDRTRISSTTTASPRRIRYTTSSGSSCTGNPRKIFLLRKLRQRARKASRQPVAAQKTQRGEGGSAPCWRSVTERSRMLEAALADAAPTPSEQDAAIVAHRQRRDGGLAQSCLPAKEKVGEPCGQKFHLPIPAFPPPPNLTLALALTLSSQAHSVCSAKDHATTPNLAIAAG
ncbi:hypothetical protein L1887_54516 [Cichorium endivia]|nr:hypothetical protein L1887_54516 [Cichorium endivia]